MAKGQKRSGREPKKPKAGKAKPPAAGGSSSTLPQSGRPAGKPAGK